MMRLTLAALLLPAAAAQGDCTADQCCTANVHNNCKGNTHSGTVAAPVLGSAQADHVCTTATHHAKPATAAGISCGDIGTACTDATCCDAHTVLTGCAAGTYYVAGSSNADGACVACATGTWKAATTDLTAAAVACAAHAVTGGAVTCVAGQQLDTDSGTATTDTVCEACPAGKHNTAATDGQPCVACAAGNLVEVGAGTGAVTTAGTTCTTCVVTTHWDHDADSSTACQAWTSAATPTACGAGTQPQAGSATADSDCVWCTAGTHKLLTDNSACITQTTPTCTTGQTYTTGGPGTAVVCEACAEGKYNTATDGSACTTQVVCTAGNEVDAAGGLTAATTCKACTAGKTSAGTGDACADITGYCEGNVDGDDAGTDLDSFACDAGSYVADNVQLVTTVEAVVGVACPTGCSWSAGSADTTVAEVEASVTVYGAAATGSAAVAAGCTADDGTDDTEGCAAGTAAYVAAVSPSTSSADVVCPAPAAAEAKTAGAAAAAPLAAFAAVVAALL